MPARASRPRPKDAPEDIECPPLEDLSWGTPQKTQVSIQKVYAYTEARAHEAINWYLHSKQSKANWSRRLRIIAIVLTTLGGLAPSSGRPACWRRAATRY